MMREQFRLTLAQPGRLLLYRCRRACMECAPAAAQQHAVRRVSDKSVLEGIDCVRSIAPLAGEPGIDELLQAVQQSVFRKVRDRCQQCLRKLAPEERTDLRNLLRGWNAIQS